MSVLYRQKESGINSTFIWSLEELKTLPYCVRAFVRMKTIFPSHPYLSHPLKESGTHSTAGPTAAVATRLLASQREREIAEGNVGLQ